MPATTKKAKQIYSKRLKKVKDYLFLRCKLAFAFIKSRDIICQTYQNTENPGFPLVKFTFFRHRERFEILNTKLILIESPKSLWQLP